MYNYTRNIWLETARVFLPPPPPYGKAVRINGGMGGGCTQKQSDSSASCGLRAG